MILRCALGALLSLPTAALAAPDLQLTWESEASAGKLVLAGTVTTPQPVPKDTALHLEVHRLGDAPEKLEAEGTAQKKGKKLKFVAKGLGAGSYQVRVWIDLDGDGACGGADLDGWFSEDKKQVAAAQDAAAAVELDKKPNRKVDFLVGPAAAAAPAEPAPPPAPEKPAWVEHSSGPWTEGEARWIIGVSFGTAADAAAAEAKARSALRDKNDDFAMLLGNQFTTSRTAAGAKVAEAELGALTAAWSRATAEPDGLDTWASPTGNHHARARLELARVLERLAADTSLAEPLRQWLQSSAASAHEVFTQLER